MAQSINRRADCNVPNSWNTCEPARVLTCRDRLTDGCLPPASASVAWRHWFACHITCSRHWVTGPACLGTDTGAGAVYCTLETTGTVHSVDIKTELTISIFTARCTLVQSAVLRSHVVCLSVRLSVTLVDCDHIGWNSSKIISPLVSLGCSLFATRTWRVCSKGNTPKFRPKVTRPCWFERRRHSIANCSRMVTDMATVTMESL